MASNRSANWYKIVGELLLLPPVAVPLVFGFGELAEGIVSGTGHFLQAAPLAFLAAISWNYAKIGGLLLVAFALAGGIFHVVANYGFPPKAIPPITFYLFGLALLSGISFLKASGIKTR